MRIKERWRDYVPITWAEFSMALAAVTIAMLLLGAAVGCQTFTPKPENVSEVIGAGYATATTVSHDIAHAVTVGAIKPNEAKAMLAGVSQALLLLDTARSAYVGGVGIPPDAPKALRLAQQADMVLQSAIAALKAKQG